LKKDESSFEKDECPFGTLALSGLLQPDQSTMFKLSPRTFLLPALLSGAGMFTLSYIWHATVLNDLKELGDDFGLYLLFNITGNLLLGLLLATLQLGLLRFEWIDTKENPVPKMLMAGMFIGMMLGCVVLALSLPLKGRVDAAHVWLDLSWQIVEQGAGGLLAAFGLFIDRVNANLEREGAL
jgi:hypothetical protein